jgi:hypothetical protein
MRIKKAFKSTGLPTLSEVVQYEEAAMQAEALEGGTSDAAYRITYPLTLRKRVMQTFLIITSGFALDLLVHVEL